MESFDYRNLALAENYIFSEVGPKFRETKKIDPLDFYIILNWKASRARTKAFHRLRKKSQSFKRAVEEISNSLASSSENEERLKILMCDWKFRLPTATAILSVLYEDDFTIYDRRVCGVLNFKQFVPDFSDKNWPRIWDVYQAFVKVVREKAPSELSLRDKDRYLWGKSVYQDLQSELEKDLES